MVCVDVRHANSLGVGEMPDHAEICLGFRLDGTQERGLVRCDLFDELKEPVVEGSWNFTDCRKELGVESVSVLEFNGLSVVPVLACSLHAGRVHGYISRGSAVPRGDIRDSTWVSHSYVDHRLFGREDHGEIGFDSPLGGDSFGGCVVVGVLAFTFHHETCVLGQTL